MELLRQPVWLDVEDSKRHLKFTFQVPVDVEALEVAWSFTPWTAGSLKNHLTLSLYDPDGFRGAGHRHGQEHRVVIGRGQATPGYLPGSIPAGNWTVTIHTHAVLAAIQGDLVVRAVKEQLEVLPIEAPSTGSDQSTCTDSGWIIGDLHCHTTHSDARWTPDELGWAAARRGLDFLALTDHNTVSGRAELARAFAGLVLPGLELTTFHGHALMVGREEYTDWTGLEPQWGMKALLDELQPTSAYLSIAHPFAAGDPVCTGCAWTYFDLRPENATHMEVWNGPWAGRHNERALTYWYRLLSEGHRIIATAGTDAHGASYHTAHGFTCTPATTETSQLLRQLKEGNTYLSRAAAFDIQVRHGLAAVPLGGSAPAGAWHLQLSWGDLPEGCVLTMVCDGVRRSEPLAPSKELQLLLNVQRWLNLEVRMANGELFMLSNPVFAESWGEPKQLNGFE